MGQFNSFSDHRIYHHHFSMEASGLYLIIFFSLASSFVLERRGLSQPNADTTSNINWNKMEQGYHKMRKEVSGNGLDQSKILPRGRMLDFSPNLDDAFEFQLLRTEDMNESSSMTFGKYGIQKGETTKENKGLDSRILSSSFDESSLHLRLNGTSENVVVPIIESSANSREQLNPTQIEGDKSMTGKHDFSQSVFVVVDDRDQMENRREDSTNEGTLAEKVDRNSSPITFSIPTHRIKATPNPTKLRMTQNKDSKGTQSPSKNLTGFDFKKPKNPGPNSANVILRPGQAPNFSLKTSGLGSHLTSHHPYYKKDTRRHPLVSQDFEFSIPTMFGIALVSLLTFLAWISIEFNSKLIQNRMSNPTEPSWDPFLQKIQIPTIPLTRRQPSYWIS